MYVCIYYNLIISFPLYFSPFCLNSLLRVILISLKILYSFLYRKCINHIHLLNFFYPPSLICDLLLAWPVFHNIAYICIGSITTYERKHASFGFLNLANFTLERTKEGLWEDTGCSLEGATQDILVVIELFCISTMVVDSRIC
jgi:hypothetical protein